MTEAVEQKPEKIKWQYKDPVTGKWKRTEAAKERRHLEKIRNAAIKGKMTRPFACEIIPIERLIELRVKKKLSYSQIAKIVGRTEASVRRRLKDAGPLVARVTDIESIRQTRADVLAAKGSMILDAVNPETIEKASLRDKAIAYGVLYDKESLDRHGPTQIILYADALKMRKEIDVTPEQIKEELKRRGISSGGSPENVQ